MKNLQKTKYLSYLEETYDESFEVEVFNEGSTMLKKMYGGDIHDCSSKGETRACLFSR